MLLILQYVSKTIYLNLVLILSMNTINWNFGKVSKEFLLHTRTPLIK